MYQKERLEKILSLLEGGGFVTVKTLTSQLHYSTATVNRDLNALEQMQKIKRSYGGVELVERSEEPRYFRVDRMKPEKRKIAKRAAELVEDGDTIFLDGSTTVGFIGPFLSEKKDLTVITNNLVLATYLFDRGVRVSVLGGQIMEEPYVVYDPETVECAMHYRADKFFLSAFSFTEDTVGYTKMSPYYLLQKVMIRNSGKKILLVDEEKFGRPYDYVFCPIGEMDTVISNHIFSDETKRKYPDTVFLEAE